MAAFSHHLLEAHSPALLPPPSPKEAEISRLDSESPAAIERIAEAAPVQIKAAILPLEKDASEGEPPKVSLVAQPASTPSMSSRLSRWVKNLYRKHVVAPRRAEIVSPVAPKESEWGTHANCYAYAMSCREPLNGQNGGAKPGAHHGAAVNPSGSDATVYGDALTRGAVLDGAVLVEGASIDAPPEPQEGTYLIALLCSSTGFHWLRRDEATRSWSWKDGNGDTVKHNIYEIGARRHVTIQDGTQYNLSTLVSKDKDKMYGGWRYGNMQFVSFFRVPNGGCEVAGQPK